MMQSRRTILTVLGLTAASSPAIAAESLSTTGGLSPAPGYAAPSKEFQERVAQSLESLAAAIRKGDATACRLDINSSVQFSEYMNHDVTINVEIPIVGA